MHSTKGTTGGIKRSSKGKDIQGRSKPAFARHNSHVRGSSKSQSALATKKPSQQYHMTMSTYAEKRNATGRNPNDSYDTSGDKYNNNNHRLDGGRRSNKGTRPDYE